MMRKLFDYLLFSLVIISFSLAERGDLLSYELLITRSVINAQTYIDNELAQIVSNMFSIEPAQYGYWMYKITYETIDVNGDLHVASGTVSYPRVDWPETPNQAFPLISYQHGTVLEKSSVTSQQGEWILPAILTSSGYVYVEPDYLGLGDSEGMHPYHLKETYGTATIDLLRAVRYHASYETNQYMINDQLFLVGYSEGGYATMAVHQIIERDYADEFNITISFPMAGAYSMSGIMVDLMLDQQSYGEPFYFPYVLFAYLDAYPNIGVTEDFLLPEYLFLEDWFDGYHSSSDINDMMPSVPILIMKPEEIIEFETNNDHPLRVSLRGNDLWDWVPQAPIHIFHGEGDELVPVENALLAYDQFLENGAEEVYLDLLPESYGGHQEVAPWTLFGAYQISQELKMINELGDVNQDSSISILDLVTMVNFILSGDSFETQGYLFWAGNVNLDGTVNIQDIIIVINMILVD